MGYTPYKTQLMIGLGASAIGDSWDAFVQNEKTIAEYQRVVNEGNLPIFRSHVLDNADQQMRRHILKLMTCFETKWKASDLQNELLQDALRRLEPLEADGLVKIDAYHLTVTAQGRNFLRNICMAFDARYWKKQPEGKVFSQAV
jgi:oxygen-independent coproporphyrinogen-3 oxidase